jgi:SAM-dependent methyltransferase
MARFTAVDDALQAHYTLGFERDRLTDGADQLELVRTLEVLADVLPPPPASVLDVGGGPGVYAARLARSGYRVRVVDLMPLHVEQARELAASQPEAPFVAEVGDARDLRGCENESVDVVLLLGPLYHLTEHDARVRALVEARRVVRSGGVVVAAVISRFASLLDGTVRGYLNDPRFVAMVERDLRDGQHRNPEPVNKPEWFTKAFFHRPEDIRDELKSAGLELDRLVGVEGPGGWLHRWPEEAELILKAARLAEDTPTMSAHMLAIARR